MQLKKFFRESKNGSIYLLSLVACIVISLTISNKSSDLPEIKGNVKETTVTQYQQQQINCLSEALWYEARGEGFKGMLTVANVIANRVKHSKYPNDYCSVISQPKQFSYKHQFNKSTVQKWNKECRKSSNNSTCATIHHVATIVVKDQYIPIFDDTTMWYHTTKVKPKWSASKQKIAVIGKHVFFSSADYK